MGSATASKICTTFGCCRRPTRAASAAKKRSPKRASVLSALALLRTCLTATSRLWKSSKHKYTSLVAPSPSLLSTLYLPMRSGACAVKNPVKPCAGLGMSRSMWATSEGKREDIDREECESQQGCLLILLFEWPPRARNRPTNTAQSWSSLLRCSFEMTAPKMSR